MCRYCYRCNCCLALFVGPQVNLAFRYSDAQKPKCLICNTEGRIECMGKIGPANTVLKTETRCKCDDRCVWASGPVCDCICGGANHQAGPEGYSQITTDLGAVRFTSTDPETVKKHAAIAKELEAAVEAADIRRQASELHRAFMCRSYIPDRDNWLKAKNHAERFNKALFGKVHSKRIKALSECFTD